MYDDHVAVNGNGGHRERRHVDKDGQCEVDQTARGMSEDPVRLEMANNVERNVHDSDEEIADSKVGDEDIRDGVQPSSAVDHEADERIAGQRDEKDHQVSGVEYCDPPC